MSGVKHAKKGQLAFFVKPITARKFSGNEI